MNVKRKTAGTPDRRHPGRWNRGSDLFLISLIPLPGIQINFAEEETGYGWL
jgi:hypothetical protein